jgi:glutamate 5-kinase
MQKNITIKVGSNVLTREDGSLNKEKMAQLVSQISQLKKKNYNVILISSGAVAAGRSIVSSPKQSDTISQRQIWSAVGQAQLINVYSDLFEIYNLNCAQLLVTKDDFRDRIHYLNLTNCLDALLKEGVVPIINENDAISVTELMFTDNDELSAMVCSMTNSSKLFILTNVDGIYDGDPSNANSKVIPEVSIDDMDITDSIQSAKSGFGRGGMITKYNTARKMAAQGINVIIANGNNENIILNILDEKETPHTSFLACKKQSPVKKWIAQSDGFEKGVITVNQGAKEALLSSHARSLLPVGVVSVDGEFYENDIIRIEDENHKKIALGRTTYSSSDLSKNRGKHGERPVVHYDYLFLDI